MKGLIVYITVPDRKTAERISRCLVEESLAACVTTLSRGFSRYRWKGKVESASEILMMVKTVPSRFAALMKRVKGLHPYEVPEIIALPISRGNPDYLAWLAESTLGSHRKGKR